MKLELNPDDLVAAAKDKPVSTIDFGDLKWEAKKAVEVVGRGTFYNWERDNYNVVYPPDKP